MCVATGGEGPRNEPIKSRTSLGYGLPVLNTAFLAVRDGSAWEYEHVQQFSVSQPPSREELHSIVLHYNCYPTTMADGVRPERGLVYWIDLQLFDSVGDDTRMKKGNSIRFTTGSSRPKINPGCMTKYEFDKGESLLDCIRIDRSVNPSSSAFSNFGFQCRPRTDWILGSTMSSEVCSLKMRLKGDNCNKVVASFFSKLCHQFIYEVSHPLPLIIATS